MGDAPPDDSRWLRTGAIEFPPMGRQRLRALLEAISCIGINNPPLEAVRCMGINNPPHHVIVDPALKNDVAISDLPLNVNLDRRNNRGGEAFGREI